MASTFNLVNIVFAHIDVPVFSSYILEPVAILSAILLTYLNHTRQRSSSNALLLFWPLFAASAAVWARTRLDIGLGIYRPILVSKLVVIGLGLLSFALECISPECGAELQLGEKTYAESPIVTANVFSIWVSIFVRRPRGLRLCYYSPSVG